MSKAKSIVSTVVITANDFAGYLANIKKASVSIESDLIMACMYVSQCTTKATQDAAKLRVAKTYQALRASIVGKFELAAAQLWVSRKVKAVAPVGFKWAVSESDNAKAKAAKAAKVKAEKPAETKAPVKIEVKQTIVQLRDAWITKEKANLDTYRNLIPAGKIKDVEQATAAYIATLAIILA
jgi:hypothetical protein